MKFLVSLYVFASLVTLTSQETFYVTIDEFVKEIPNIIHVDSSMRQKTGVPVGPSPSLFKYFFSDENKKLFHEMKSRNRPNVTTRTVMDNFLQSLNSDDLQSLSTVEGPDKTENIYYDEYIHLLPFILNGSDHEKLMVQNSLSGVDKVFPVYLSSSELPRYLSRKEHRATVSFGNGFHLTTSFRARLRKWDWLTPDDPIRRNMYSWLDVANHYKSNETMTKFFNSTIFGYMFDYTYSKIIPGVQIRNLGKQDYLTGNIHSPAFVDYTLKYNRSMTDEEIMRDYFMEYLNSLPFIFNGTDEEKLMINNSLAGIKKVCFYHASVLRYVYTNDPEHCATASFGNDFELTGCFRPRECRDREIFITFPTLQHNKYTVKIAKVSKFDRNKSNLQITIELAQIQIMIVLLIAFMCVVVYAFRLLMVEE